MYIYIYLIFVTCHDVESVLEEDGGVVCAGPGVPLAEEVDLLGQRVVDGRGNGHVACTMGE
jgi:hypothetical protein